MQDVHACLHAHRFFFLLIHTYQHIGATIEHMNIQTMNNTWNHHFKHQMGGRVAVLCTFKNHTWLKSCYFSLLYECVTDKATCVVPNGIEKVDTNRNEFVFFLFFLHIKVFYPVVLWQITQWFSLSRFWFSGNRGVLVNGDGTKQNLKI